jgi:hypothetical protein
MRTSKKHYIHPVKSNSKPFTSPRLQDTSRLSKYLHLKQSCPHLAKYSGYCTCKYNTEGTRKNKHKLCDFNCCPFKNNNYDLYYGVVKEDWAK